MRYNALNLININLQEPAGFVKRQIQLCVLLQARHIYDHA
jgi:hypothetical protein